jgi:hypothetical protein
MRTKFWLESLNGRDDSEDLAVYGSIILKRIIRKWSRRVWAELIWLRMRTSGRLF